MKLSSRLLVASVLLLVGGATAPEAMSATGPRAIGRRAVLRRAAAVVVAGGLAGVALGGCRSQATASGAEARGDALPPAPTARGAAWRGAVGSPERRRAAAMAARARRFAVAIDGVTALSVFRQAILDNPRVTNDQLAAMSRVTIEQLDSGAAARAQTLAKFPGARELPSHRFAVALMSAATGIAPERLSKALPDLGLTGTPATMLYAPERPWLQRSTALHDLTDFLRAAGVDGLNRAVWGVEGSVESALVSAAGGGRS